MSIDNTPQISPAGNNKWWTLAVVGAGTFMSALTGSVVNTALPVIGESTGASDATLQWVVLIYLLTTSSLLLVFGRLADIYGQRKIYISGLGVFVSGSVLCGFAPNIEALIGFRALQALGAAILFAIGPAILTAAFPGQQRGRALGLQATMTYIGLATGPALGGFLTHAFGWPSIFFVNVPIGVIILPLSLYALKPDVTPARQPFDPVGAVTLAVALTSLLLGFNQALRLGWGNPVVITALGISLIAFTAFIFVELKMAHPMLDMTLFRNRVFAASTLAAFLNYMASSSVSYLMPFYLQRAAGYRVDTAGLILITTPAVMAVVAGPAGWISDHIGHRLPATAGMIITAGALLFLRVLSPDSSAVTIVPILALLGLGVGLFTSPNNSAIMGSAPRERQGVAGAILAAARNVGFTIGVAVAVMIYLSRLNTTDTQLASPADITNAMQYATTAIAFLVVIGAVVSALRCEPNER
ncbi:MAG TPA: MFS transporter [Armatimonadota bacterium]|nr:MFS transporter [Armatimonadota bacterium]